MFRIDIKTKKKTEFIDITDLIREVSGRSGIQSGICCIFVPHTTAGITINEHADPDVCEDIINRLSVIVPDQAGYKHLEGNSAAHIKSSLVGHSQTVILENGKPVLGTWQGIFFCEFDGPRSRQLLVKIIPDK